MAPKLTVDNCNEVFCFLADFGVIVCSQHGTAVVSLDEHLSKHHAVPARDRREILERFKDFDTVAPSAVQLLEGPARQIAELGVPLNGLRCKTCSEITVSKDIMHKHCKKEHQQAWRGDTKAFYEDVKARSFFRSGEVAEIFLYLCRYWQWTRQKTSRRRSNTAA